MVAKETEKLFASSSAPHVQTNDSVTKILRTVVVSLLPVVLFSVYIFGFRVLILIVASVVAALCAETIIQLLLRRKITSYDGSAVITGLLLAMNVSPGAPVWLVVVGSFFAVIIVKQLFGGLGYNIFNPALAARAFLMISWPAHMTTGWHRFTEYNILSGGISNVFGIAPEVFDTLTQATPLSLVWEGPKLLRDMGVAADVVSQIVTSPQMIQSLFVGNRGGCIGETSAALLLLGAFVLLVRRVITWHIPVSYIGTVGIIFFAYYAIHGCPKPHMLALFQILSGGLFLGAFFMATDMVTSPVTHLGMILFGFGCGLLTFVIRVSGGYPEGVSYAILIMNAVTPLIDRYIKPKVFGT